MNTFTGLFAYFAIGGLFFSAFYNSEIKRCPNFKMDDTQFAIAVSMWPALLTASLVMDLEGKKLTPCKTPQQGAT